jgi:hypothetical protein
MASTLIIDDNQIRAERCLHWNPFEGRQYGKQALNALGDNDNKNLGCG